MICRYCARSLGWVIDYCPFCGQSQPAIVVQDQVPAASPQTASIPLGAVAPDQSPKLAPDGAGSCRDHPIPTPPLVAAPQPQPPPGLDHNAVDRRSRRPVGVKGRSSGDGGGPRAPENLPDVAPNRLPQEWDALPVRTTPLITQSQELARSIAPALMPKPADLTASSEQPTDQGPSSAPQEPVQSSPALNAIRGPSTVRTPGWVAPIVPAEPPRGPSFAGRPSAMKRNQLPSGVFADKLQVETAAVHYAPPPAGVTVLAEAFTRDAPAASALADPSRELTGRSNNEPPSQLSGLFGGLSVPSAGAGSEPHEMLSASPEQVRLRRQGSISDEGLPDIFNDRKANSESAQPAGVQTDRPSRMDPSEPNPQCQQPE